MYNLHVINIKVVFLNYVHFNDEEGI